MPEIKRRVIKDSTLKSLKRRLEDRARGRDSGGGESDIPLPGPGQRFQLWDVDPRSFGVRYDHKGGITYILMRRFRGAVVRVTLRGDDDTVLKYPDCSLADARDIARRVISQMRAGVDPREDRRFRAQNEALRRKAEEARKSQTFDIAADKFLSDHMAGKRSHRQVDLMLKPLREKWGALPISSLDTPDILEALAPYKKAGNLVTYDRRLTVIKTLFKWAMTPEAGSLVKENPAAGLKLYKVKSATTRDLSDEEVRNLWLAGDSVSYPGGPFTRLLLLTACRLREVGGMRWDEIDEVGKVWEIPSNRTKSDRPFVVPLSDMALDVLAGLDRNGPYVFASRRISGIPIGGYGHIKKALDAACDIPAWTFHDLRRTARTGWSRLRIDKDIRERLMNHAMSELEATYDRYSFLDEKRAALQAWANRLREIVYSEPGSNVVRLDNAR